VSPKQPGHKMSTTVDPTLASAAEFAGLKILIAEDEYLISLMLQQMLEDLGCAIVGAAENLTAALSLVSAGGADVAILDVNLGGQSIYPVADLLAAKRVPIIFATGYGQQGLNESYRGHTILAKPYDVDAVRSSLLRARAAATAS
jgi:CheY-like chemotaxis protein